MFQPSLSYHTARAEGLGRKADPVQFSDLCTVDNDIKTSGKEAGQSLSILSQNVGTTERDGPGP